MQLQLTSSMFGCHAHVVQEDNSWDLGYIEDAELAGKFRQRLHGDVWMWRNPRCQLRELRDILVSLEHASDQFSLRLRAVENSDDFYAILYGLYTILHDLYTMLYELYAIHDLFCF